MFYLELPMSIKLPNNADISWFKEPDVSTVGNKVAVIRVTYADSSYDDVRITVNVVDNRKDNEKVRTSRQTS